MKRIMQSTLALAIAMTFSVGTVKAQELEEIIVTLPRRRESSGHRRFCNCYRWQLIEGCC